MKNGFRRRADFGDLQFEQKLGLVETELAEYAETDTERAALQQEIDRLRVVIEERKPKPAPEGGMSQNPTHDEYVDRPAFQPYQA